MNRPAVAIISNSCPPYRLHVHRRIAAEIPQIRLYSVFTHEKTDVAIGFNPPAEIGPVSFGSGESMVKQSPRHEWRKGGRIIDWMQANNVRAAVVSGYNDPGRLRIIRHCASHGIACFMHADSNVHSDRTTGVKKFIKRRLVTWVVRKCDAILVCGSLGKQYYLNYGARPERIFYYPYEPDYSMIRELSAGMLDAARQRFGLDPLRRRIVYSGRLIPVKRVDFAIEAFASIAARRPEWDLVIVGDGPLRGELEARVPDALKSRVTWTGFLNDQAAISAIYRLSDVLVLPSSHEPWAVVVNEAVAAGMAIITSDVVGAAAELVRQDVNGRTFPSGNLPALTEALLRVTDPSHIDALKTGSAAVLRDWQLAGDPINGLRQALVRSNIISA